MDSLEPVWLPFRSTDPEIAAHILRTCGWVKILQWPPGHEQATPVCVYARSRECLPSADGAGGQEDRPTGVAGVDYFVGIDNLLRFVNRSLLTDYSWTEGSVTPSTSVKRMLAAHAACVRKHSPLVAKTGNAQEAKKPKGKGKRTGKEVVPVAKGKRTGKEVVPVAKTKTKQPSKARTNQTNPDKTVETTDSSSNPPRDYVLWSDCTLQHELEELPGGIWYCPTCSGKKRNNIPDGEMVGSNDSGSDEFEMEFDSQPAPAKHPVSILQSSQERNHVTEKTAPTSTPKSATGTTYMSGPSSSSNVMAETNVSGPVTVAKIPKKPISRGGVTPSSSSSSANAPAAVAPKPIKMGGPVSGVQTLGKIVPSKIVLGVPSADASGSTKPPPTSEIASAPGRIMKRKVVSIGECDLPNMKASRTDDPQHGGNATNTQYTDKMSPRDSIVRSSDILCRYLSDPGGCYSGAQCRFMHPSADTRSSFEGGRSRGDSSKQPNPLLERLPREEVGGSKQHESNFQQSLNSEKSLKVYVRGCPNVTTDSDLYKYFSTFGAVQNAVTYKTGSTGYVTFKEEIGLLNCLSKSRHELLGNFVDVLKWNRGGENNGGAQDRSSKSSENRSGDTGYGDPLSAIDDNRRAGSGASFSWPTINSTGWCKAQLRQGNCRNSKCPRKHRTAAQMKALSKIQCSQLNVTGGCPHAYCPFAHPVSSANLKPLSPVVSRVMESSANAVANDSDDRSVPRAVQTATAVSDEPNTESITAKAEAAKKLLLNLKILQKTRTT